MSTETTTPTVTTEETPTAPHLPSDGERGKVVSGDPESLECVCGNCAVFEGWISSTVEGVAFHPYGMPIPDALADALAAWPEDEDEMHRLCRVCGRIYRDATIRDTNTAPVVRIADLTDGSPARNALLAFDGEEAAPTVDRLYVNDNGNVACAQHGGGYLYDSIKSNPRRKLHRTPLGTWERFTGPTAKAELDGAACDSCGATL